jgi:hypothetical protein
MFVSGTEKDHGSAGDFADATRESYRIVVSRAFTDRESDSRLTRDFFERTTVEIQEQTRLNHCATRLQAHTSRRGEPVSLIDTTGTYDMFLFPSP